jgi:hypothetical protein
MATNETVAEPVVDEEIAVKNRHNTGAPLDTDAPVDDAETASAKPVDAPQKNRHNTSEPAD